MIPEQQRGCYQIENIPRPGAEETCKRNMTERVNASPQRRRAAQQVVEARCLMDATQAAHGRGRRAIYTRVWLVAKCKRNSMYKILMEGRDVRSMPTTKQEARKHRELHFASVVPLHYPITAKFDHHHVPDAQPSDWEMLRKVNRPHCGTAIEYATFKLGKIRSSTYNGNSTAPDWDNYAVQPSSTSPEEVGPRRTVLRSVGGGEPGRDRRSARR